MSKISNFYVPIDYSDLLKIIPEDVNEILYSTLCQAIKKESFSLERKWNTHVLITKLGFAYTELLEEDQTKSIFYKWVEIHDDKTLQIKKNKIYFNFTWYSVVRDEVYESKEDFKYRAKNFGSFCKDLYDATNNDYMKYFIEKNSKILVPINYSDLYDILPEGEKLLRSTLCAVQIKNVKVASIGYRTGIAHVLITKSGIAYNSSFEVQKKTSNFYYWNKHKFKFKKEEIRLFIDRSDYISFMEMEKFDSEKNFPTFCKMVRTVYLEYINEMTNYLTNIAEKFAKDGYDNFIEKLVPFLFAGYYDKAIDIIEELLKIIPESKGGDLWYYKAQALISLRTYKEFLNRSQEALNSYNMALKINPNDERVLDKKNELVLEMKLFSIPLKVQNKARTLFLAGKKNFNKNNYEKAMEFYNKALKLNPYDIKTWNNKGNTLEAIGKFKKAINCYEEALKLNPKDYDATRNLKKCEDNMGKYGDVASFCSQCGKILPLNSQFCGECGTQN